MASLRVDLLRFTKIKWIHDNGQFISLGLGYCNTPR